MATTYQAPSVNKAFRILRLLSRAQRGLGITEIADRLGMSKGTVHGMVTALKHEGAIIRIPATKKYTLGVTLFELGKQADSQFGLKNLARPVMERLVMRTSETVYLGVLNTNHITILDVVESTRDHKITSPKGTMIPLFAGATGKVMLASMEPEEAFRIISNDRLPRFTEQTITEPDRYLREVARARKEGYATDDEEYMPGVRAVAAPIRGWLHLIAAIWVVGFKTSLDNGKIEDVIVATKAAADEISALCETSR